MSNRGAQEKIALLTANILFKNLKIEQDYEMTKKHGADLLEKLEEAKNNLRLLMRAIEAEAKSRIPSYSA